MESSSLQNSESLKSLNQDLNQTEVLSQYLTSRFDWFATTVLDYMEEKDPKKRFGKMSEGIIKERDYLRQQNKELHQKVAQLQNKISGLQSELIKIKCPKQTNGQSVFSSASQIENSSNSVANLSQHMIASTFQILPEEQRKALQQIDEIDEITRIRKEQEQIQINALQQFLENLFERLKRMVKLQKITEGDLLNEQTLTVTISKQKYDLLLDFYFKGAEKRKKSESQIGEFSAQSSVAPNQSNQKTQIWSIEDLQKMFQSLAQMNGKQKEWSSYLQNKQSQNQKQLTNLKQVALRQIPQQEREKLREAKDSLRLDQSVTDNSTNLNTTAATSIVDSLQKKVGDNLFEKIKDLMKALSFSQQQYDLFVLFDQKRKSSRLFDVDEFLNKFKNKTDLSEISQAYSVYLIKTINFLLINVMQLLSGSNPENMIWFKEKLTKQSNEYRKDISEAIEKQLETYINQKQKNYKEEKRELKEILGKEFDKEKKLQKELVKIVYKYKDLVKSSIFNHYSQINLIF